MNKLILIFLSALLIAGCLPEEDEDPSQEEQVEDALDSTEPEVNESNSTLTSVQEVAEDPNQTLAQEVDFNVSVSGNLGTDQDSDDYFAFTLTESSWVAVTLTGPDQTDFDIDIFSGNEANGFSSSIAGSYNFSSREAIVVKLDQGTYTVGIEQWEGAGNYSLTIGEPSRSVLGMNEGQDLYYFEVSFTESCSYSDGSSEQDSDTNNQSFVVDAAAGEINTLDSFFDDDEESHPIMIVGADGSRVNVSIDIQDSDSNFSYTESGSGYFDFGDPMTINIDVSSTLQDSDGTETCETTATSANGSRVL